MYIIYFLKNHAARKCSRREKTTTMVLEKRLLASHLETVLLPVKHPSFHKCLSSYHSLQGKLSERRFEETSQKLPITANRGGGMGKEREGEDEGERTGGEGRKRKIPSYECT